MICTMKPSTRPTRLRKAFTLLEVLVVVAILVVLASAAVIYVPKYLDDAKKGTAKSSISTLASAVEAYRLKNEGNLPQQLELVRPYLKDADKDPFMDPWNKPYIYEVTEINGKEVPIIYTKAPDGETIANARAN